MSNLNTTYILRLITFLVLLSCLSAQLRAQDHFGLTQLDSLSHRFDDRVVPAAYSTEPVYTNADFSVLEKRIEQLEQQLGHSTDVEPILGVCFCQKCPSCLKGKSAKPSFQVGGRIHLDYWAFPENDPGIGFFEYSDPTSPRFGNDPDNAVLFRRTRLEMKGDISESMFWRMQIDFADPDLAAIKDVYGAFRGLPFNQSLFIGHHKRPLGLDHLNSSRFNVFIERPFVIEAFNEDARRVGISARGHNDAESFIWQYGVYDLQNIAILGQYRGDNSQVAMHLRMAGSPMYKNEGQHYFHWAVAGMFAFPDGNRDGDDINRNEARFRTRPEARSITRWLDTGRIVGAKTYEILGLESIYNAGPLQLVGEYQFNWLQRESFAGSSDANLFFHGAYIYASYFVTGEHIPYDRKSGTIGRVKPFHPVMLVKREPYAGWGAWQVAYRYSYLDVSDEDILGGHGESHTLGMNWWWNSNARVQFNLIYGTIEDHEPVGGFTSGDYLIVGTRFAIDF